VIILFIKIAKAFSFLPCVTVLAFSTKVFMLIFGWLSDRSLILIDLCRYIVIPKDLIFEFPVLSTHLSIGWLT